MNAKAFIWDAESRLSQVWSQHNNNTYSQSAIYSYDAEGNRVRADQMIPGQNAGTYVSNSFQEYSFFGGQMMAEKAQVTGQPTVWTDYIYANGKKIARVSLQNDPHLHIQGTATHQAPSSFLRSLSRLTTSSGPATSCPFGNTRLRIPEEA